MRSPESGGAIDSGVIGVTTGTEEGVGDTVGVEAARALDALAEGADATISTDLSPSEEKFFSSKKVTISRFTASSAMSAMLQTGSRFRSAEIRCENTAGWSERSREFSDFRSASRMKDMVK